MSYHEKILYRFSEHKLYLEQKTNASSIQSISKKIPEAFGYLDWWIKLPSFKGIWECCSSLSKVQACARLNFKHSEEIKLGNSGTIRMFQYVWKLRSFRCGAFKMLWKKYSKKVKWNPICTLSFYTSCVILHQDDPSQVLFQSIPWQWNTLKNTPWNGCLWIIFTGYKLSRYCLLSQWKNQLVLSEGATGDVLYKTCS